MTPNDSGVFNPDDFMNMTVEGVGSTSITPIPAGTYLAFIPAEENAVKYSVRDRVDGKGGKMHMLSITFTLIDDSGAIRAAIDGRDPKHTETYFLDTTPSGTLDMGKGKNVKLNRLRDALNQNSGAPWSPMMLRGAGPLALQLTIQPDARDKETPRNVLKAVGRPGALK